MAWYLETIGSSLNHDKAISIKVGNLNSGHSYLITAVDCHRYDDFLIILCIL